MYIAQKLPLAKYLGEDTSAVCWRPPLRLICVQDATLSYGEFCLCYKVLRRVSERSLLCGFCWASAVVLYQVSQLIRFP